MSVRRRIPFLMRRTANTPAVSAFSPGGLVFPNARQLMIVIVAILVSTSAFSQTSGRVVTGQTRLVRLNFDMRIDIPQTITGRLDLSSTKILGTVNDLSLEV